MSGFNDFLARFAPGIALGREINAAKLDVLQRRRSTMSGNYAPTGGGRRSKEFRRNSQDAQLAMRGERGPLAYIARDMLRNNPRVVRANNLIANYAIGSGVVPTVQMRSDEDSRNKSLIEGYLHDHFMTTSIDADGLNVLAQLQKINFRAIPTGGEVITRRRYRRAKDPFELPFQIQVLETDFLVGTLDRQGTAGQSKIEGGIEYNAMNQPAAYWLYTEHPGAQYGGQSYRRVDASNIAFSFDAMRPGQRRGVSWYAPIMTLLHDLQKFQDATLKRQEMAAMFAGILQNHGLEAAEGYEKSFDEMEPGGIIEIGKEEDLTFNTPPQDVTAEPMHWLIERTIAAALMLTYSSFSGDYSRVNYSASRAERNDQDPTIQGWQNHLMIGQTLSKLGVWSKEAIMMKRGIDPDSYRIGWNAPVRPVVDPTKDWPALRIARDAGFKSRRGIIRDAGKNPDEVDAEILTERQWESEHGIDFNPAAAKDDNEEKTNEKGGK